MGAIEKSARQFFNQRLNRTLGHRIDRMINRLLDHVLEPLEARVVDIATGSPRHRKYLQTDLQETLEGMGYTKQDARKLARSVPMGSVDTLQQALVLALSDANPPTRVIDIEPVESAVAEDPTPVPDPIPAEN